MSSVIRYPGPEGILVYSGIRSLPMDAEGKPTPGRAGMRHRLSFQLSSDQGISWPVVRELDGGASAYSDLAITAEGDILCLYESGTDIHIAKVSLGWIQHGAKTP